MASFDRIAQTNIEYSIGQCTDNNKCKLDHGE